MLLRSGMVERTSGTDALSLEMPSGKSAIIRDLYLYMAAAGAEDLTITIDRKVVMQFVAPSGMYLLGGNRVGGYIPIMDTMRQAGLFPEIPLAEGEKLEITAPGANNYMEAVYDMYTAEDVKSTDANGSKSDYYRLFQVVSNSGVRATAGDLALDQSDLNTVFPAFPGGDVVPANTVMDLHALFGAASTKGTGAANGEYTTYVKALADREDIFDLDLGGITFLGDATYVTADVKYETIAGRIGAGVQHAPPRIIKFDPPIIFNPGAELNMYATLVRTGEGGDFVAGDVKLGMVFNVSRRT